MLLSPGVTNDGGFGLVGYRGISGLYNNNTIDGVDNNQACFSEARGRTRASYSVSQAAIQEFQVGVSNFSAEFGRSAGGTVNAVTKSGTNESRGEGFYYLGQDALQDREPFATIKPEERRQQFGFSAGGPISADKVFFFVNFDQQRRDFPEFVRGRRTTFLDGACTATGCAATSSYFRGPRACCRARATTGSCSARSTPRSTPATTCRSSTTCTGGSPTTACRPRRSCAGTELGQRDGPLITDFAARDR